MTTTSQRGVDHADVPVLARPRRRGTLLVLLALGVGLALAPAAFQMFERAPKGATMIADFKPFMTEDRLDGFSREIAQFDAAVREIDNKAPAHLDPLRAGGADYRLLRERWPAINDDMSGLLTDVHRNLGNYQAVAALPNFRLFPWFFVVPGTLVAAAAALALWRPAARRFTAVAIGLIGVGLAAAPLAFGMFTRAPQGGRMMDAFENIQTTQKVTEIQDHFSTMALGQGAIRLQLTAALERSGLSPQQLRDEFPAVAALNRDWVHILNDMTPMIGAMSDNVDSYQAVAALPPFPLFPWFFAVPGVLAIGLAVAAFPREEGVS